MIMANFRKTALLIPILRHRRGGEPFLPGNRWQPRRSLYEPAYPKRRQLEQPLRD